MLTGISGSKQVFSWSQTIASRSPLLNAVAAADSAVLPSASASLPAMRYSPPWAGTCKV